MMGNIVAIIKKHGVELKKVGKNYKGLCPFHREKTPSFTVSPRNQTFFCFGCGKSGNAVDFERLIKDDAGIVPERHKIINKETFHCPFCGKEKQIIEQTSSGECDQCEYEIKKADLARRNDNVRWIKGYGEE